MAEIAKSGTPSLSSDTPPQSSTIIGLRAGENIAACDACYIHTNGMIYRATGAAANAAAKVRGFAFMKANAGEAVSLYFDVNFRYGAGLTPGTTLYLSGTVPGGLADAASTGGTVPVGFVVDATRIRVFAARL